MGNHGLAGFLPPLLLLRIRSGSWVWDPSGYHLQALRPGDRGELQRFQRFFFGVFFGGVQSSWMFIYLFIYFFGGGGVMFPLLLHVFKGFFWNKQIWDTQGSTCRPSDPLLVARQVLGSYEVGWPNKASICWNLSWVTLWHLTVLPTGLKRKVESRLEIDILIYWYICCHTFLEFPHISTDVATKRWQRALMTKLMRLQQAEAAGEQEVFGVWVVLDEDVDPVYTPWN